MILNDLVGKNIYSCQPLKIEMIKMIKMIVLVLIALFYMWLWVYTIRFAIGMDLDGKVHGVVIYGICFFWPVVLPLLWIVRGLTNAAVPPIDRY